VIAAALCLHQKPALFDMRFVKGFAEIEDRRECDVFVREPFDPFGAGFGFECGAKEVDQFILFTRRRLSQRQEVETVKRSQKVGCKFDLAPT